MDNKKKDTPEAQQGDSAENGNIPRSERPPNILNRWMELLLQLGLGESALRLATNILLLVAVVGVILLMQGFYKRLETPEANGSRVRALAQAQRELRATKQYSHPYYWAPFVLVGQIGTSTGYAG